VTSAARYWGQRNASPSRRTGPLFVLFKDRSRQTVLLEKTTGTGVLGLPLYFGCALLRPSRSPGRSCPLQRPRGFLSGLDKFNFTPEPFLGIRGLERVKQETALRSCIRCWGWVNWFLAVKVAAEARLASLESHGMKRRWLLVLGFTFLAGVLLLWLMWPESDEAIGLTTYDRIELGMSRAEVEGTVNLPPGDYRGRMAGNYRTFPPQHHATGIEPQPSIVETLQWHTDRFDLAVAFDDMDKVAAISFVDWNGDGQVGFIDWLRSRLGI
jgi:hypothetical protein